MYTNRMKSERPRKKGDLYETPPELARAAIQQFEQPQYTYHPNRRFYVLDPGSGGGVWGDELKKLVTANGVLEWHSYFNLVGVELGDEHEPHEAYHQWFQEDFLSFEYPRQFDYVMGNPPYSLAEEFIRKGIELLRPWGQLLYLLRLEFLGSKKRHFGLFTDLPPYKVITLSRRPSFFSSDPDGKRKTTDALVYALFIWRKGHLGKPTMDWLYWEYDK